GVAQSRGRCSGDGGRAEQYDRRSCHAAPERAECDDIHRAHDTGAVPGMQAAQGAQGPRRQWGALPVPTVRARLFRGVTMSNIITFDPKRRRTLRLPPYKTRKDVQLVQLWV